MRVRARQTSKYRYRRPSMTRKRRVMKFAMTKRAGVGRFWLKAIEMRAEQVTIAQLVVMSSLCRQRLERCISPR
jgi:hypothetical protein